MRARRPFLAIAAALALGACTHNTFTPNVIRLSPSGTATNPAKVSKTAPFTLTAVEDGYTSQFTADVTVGTCWVVQTPVTTGGAWTVVPQGSTCGSGETDKILVQDEKGNSAVTYVH